VQALWKSDVVKHQPRSGSIRFELELRNRIDTFRPGHDAPGLNDPVIRKQFHIPPDNVATKERERSANFPIDFRWSAGEGSELVGV